MQSSDCTVMGKEAMQPTIAGGAAHADVLARVADAIQHGDAADIESGRHGPTRKLLLLRSNSGMTPGVKRGGCSAIQGSPLPASAYALARKGYSRRGPRTVPRAPKAAHPATTATRPAPSLVRVAT